MLVFFHFSRSEKKCSDGITTVLTVHFKKGFSEKKSRMKVRERCPGFKKETKKVFADQYLRAIKFEKFQNYTIPCGITFKILIRLRNKKHS